MDDGPGVALGDTAHLFKAFFSTNPRSKAPALASRSRTTSSPVTAVSCATNPSIWERGAAISFGSARASRSVAGRRGRHFRHRPAADLVLDDEPSIGVFLDKALRAFGYAVVTARSGEEAIEIARDQDFDVYLVDHQMAGATGLDVFESVTEARPDTRPAS